jgi:hypothetical protein
MEPGTRVAYAQEFVDKYDNEVFNGTRLSDMRGTVEQNPHGYEGIMVDWDQLRYPRLMDPNCLKEV